jgi:co-chaperonin GroES (HSP10)
MAIQVAKGKYLCEVLRRERKLSSGLWIADRIKAEKKDNIARVIDVGAPGTHLCEKCEEYDPKSKRSDKCFRAWKVYPCDRKNKPQSILAKKGDVVHFKPYFGSKITIEGKECIFLTNADVICVERN